MAPGFLAVSRPGVETATECPCCRFDALVSFPIHLVTEDGFNPFGACEGCVHCFEARCECQARWMVIRP